MEPVRLIEIGDPATQVLFETMFKNRNLVPVVGAGFTRGARTAEGAVPDRAGFCQVMLASLREHAGDDADVLSTREFTEIAEYFLNPRFVPAAVSKAILRKHFLGVRLDPRKRAFLDCPWPYVYTLNIDDGIESNSSFKNKVVPNRPIAEMARSLPCVYKVHGDVADELTYDEPSRIIFSTGHYVRSLSTNTSMLTALKTDLTEQNTLFVGCSLSNEIDLLFALAEYHGRFPPGRESIYVTSDVLNRFDIERLASHGVNTVLKVDSYDTFYETIASWGHSAAAASSSVTAALKLSSTGLQRLERSRAPNLAFLLREATPASDSTRHSMVLPAYYARRDIEDAVVASSLSAPLTLLRGRRFSGKTLLLRSLGSAAKAKNVFFVDSDTRASHEIMDSLVSIDNGLLVFDTNSLTPDSAYFLTTKVSQLEQRHTNAVIAVNRTEPDVTGALIRHVGDENDFELDSRLSRRECESANGLLDELGLLRFDHRRTLLENTFATLAKYPEVASTLVSASVLSEREVELLLIVAIADKAYSSVATALSVRSAELFAFCEKLAPVIDIVETARSEVRDTHSRYKVVTNSRTGLALQIREVVKSRGYEWLSMRLTDLVRRLIELPQFSSVAHSMYMFDAVNHVLSHGDAAQNTGFRPVVRKLYEDLQATLSHSPDYWLQRAKAVLRIEDSEDRLLEGIQFAVKCFHEADRQRTTDNAEFLIAQLYGKLCGATNYSDAGHIRLAVSWFAQAIRNYQRNMNYVQSMLDESRRRKGSFDRLCDHLEKPVSDASLLPLKRDVDYLLSVRRSWS